MVKPACFDSNGMKKGAWSEEEDNKLRSYVDKYGHWNWRLLPKYAGLARCGKSCRLRWVNYLKPGVKKDKFSKQETNLIIQMHQQLGNKWSAIAEKLPGRTDNDIKNYWNAHIHKRVNRRSKKSPMQNGSITQLSDQDSVNAINDEILCDKSVETSGSSTYDHSDSCNLQSEDESFWNDPALADLTNIGIEHYFPTLALPEHQLHHNEFLSSGSSEWNVADGDHSIIPSYSLTRAEFEQGHIWDEPYFPTLTLPEHQLHHNEFLSSNSSDFLPALEWNVADGDHVIIPSDSLTRAEFEQGHIWDEPYYWESDFQGDIRYSTDLAAQEEEISYDIFRDFDFSMNLF